MLNLHRLDLNLLRTLDVLLSENNVTRAAQRLNLSQPSVSIQLARLREIFADPLLMPGPRGMQPTARADELRQPLRAALAALEQAVAPVAPFDPATAAETWRVAATDYMASAILLPMLGRLRLASPGSRLAVFELQPARLEQQAASDTVDLFFHTREGAPPGLHQRLLFRERYVLAGRAEHPALRPGLSLETFCQLEHVIVSPDGGGFSAATDTALANLGLARRVVLSVPHFLFMLETLRNSDLVAVLPERLAPRPGASMAASVHCEFTGGTDMLSGLNHLTLAVSQLAPSVAFYQQLLGMTLHARWDSGAYLSCGDLWLCLSLDPQRRITPSEESDYTHYAFSISEADFASFAARLEVAGVAVWKLNRSEGASHYFLDPDGHKLELHVGSLDQRLAACREQPYKGMVFFDQ